MHYEWGYHSSDEQHVHVARVDGTRREDLFDVTLYDPDCPSTNHPGLNAMQESLLDLRELVGYANAALKAGLEPEPVPDREDDSTLTCSACGFEHAEHDEFGERDGCPGWTYGQ